MEYGGKWQMSLWAESLRAVTCFHPLCISPQPRDVHGPKNGCLLAQNDTLSRTAAQLAADDISHEQHTSLCGLSPHPHPVWRLPTARNGHVGPQCSGRWNVSGSVGAASFLCFLFLPGKQLQGLEMQQNLASMRWQTWEWRMPVVDSPAERDRDTSLALGCPASDFLLSRTNTHLPESALVCHKVCYIYLHVHIHTHILYMSCYQSHT